MIQKARQSGGLELISLLFAEPWFLDEEYHEHERTETEEHKIVQELG
ncbi:MAG TPA: hypothetical protein PLD99_02625 [Parcubacteria group bacterium]|nr:hypothetical protein [Parcubacteria group bacterium]